MLLVISWTNTYITPQPIRGIILKRQRLLDIWVLLQMINEDRAARAVVWRSGAGVSDYCMSGSVHSHTHKHFTPLTFTHSPCHCLLSPIIKIPISWSKWSSLYCILSMISCVISFLLNWKARNCFSARRCHNKVWQLQLAVLPPVPGKHLLFAMKTSKGLWILNCI